jgi:hypothetical protein
MNYMQAVCRFFLNYGGGGDKLFWSGNDVTYAWGKSPFVTVNTQTLHFLAISVRGFQHLKFWGQIYSLILSRWPQRYKWMQFTEIPWQFIKNAKQTELCVAQLFFNEFIDVIFMNYLSKIT